MHKTSQPPALSAGDTIAFFTPSYPGPALYPERLRSAKEALEALGYRVHVPESALINSGYTAGTGKRRAEALKALFCDETIDAIICTLGGFNTTEILPVFDFQVARNNPKIIMGYSDATALLLAIYEKTGLITFHGPAALPQWGEYPGPIDYTIQSFKSIVEGYAPPIALSAPASWTAEFLDWNMPSKRQRNHHLSEGWTPVVYGTAEGTLIGGNIETINMLVGTAFLPSFRGSIAFLEATESEAFLPRLKRSLYHLFMSNTLDGIVGILFGRMPDASNVSGTSLHELAEEVGRQYQVPVAMNIDFGHTDPMLTVPIGIKARVECKPDEVSISLLERAVAVGTK